MRTFIAMLVIVCFVVVPVTSFAAQGGQKGPDANAFENANDKAKFKREGQVGKAGDQDQDKDKEKKKKKKKKKKGKGKNKAD